ncbi:Outer membrane cobalamin receptor protein, SusC/RagA family [Bacteroidales bacterium Barb6]|nr:Outer membrane cobalamin receptor protein, SusC/RagA family [Bacteroidales bacterium Barb6]
MRKIMRGYFALVLVGLLQLSAVAAYGQAVIRGTVVDEKQVPVIGATVVQKGTTNGVGTDLDGKFEFKAKQALPITLLVHLIGYREQEVDVYDAEEAIRVTLIENYNVLDEIVVTGYTVQQRKSISGSIVSLNVTDALKDAPDQDINKLLQGRASGVQVLSNNGVPGGGVTFLIRGNNSINGSVDPLYVIDGVFVGTGGGVSLSGGQASTNPLADINPADIENISILKDANATAIYGSQGANGVVIITTKRGKLNSKAKISLNISHGWSDAVKKFQTVSGPETGLLVNESVRNTAIDGGIDLSTVTLPFPDYASLPTYERNDDLFRTANSSNYELSAQGGTAAGAYYVGLGYTRQEAIIKPSGFERFSGRVNYDNNLTDRLKVGTSLNVVRTYRNVSGNDNDPTGVINSAIFVRSYLPVFKEDGSYARYGAFDNHLALIEHLDNNAVIWRSIANLFAEYSFLPELKFRTSWSFDNSELTENNYFDTFTNAGVAAKGRATALSNRNVVYTAEQLLTYLKTFGEGNRHSINALLGNTVNSRQQERVSSSGSGFATNDLKDISVAATTSGSSSASESRLLSFFGKAGYVLDGKYTLDGSIRADASSRFGKNHRWGYFPATGVTWNAGLEDFIKELHVFDALKFRGSFGYSGNQNGIGSYAALGLWSANAAYLETAGISPYQLANPDLTWETTRQIDLGVEFTILKNRLHIDFDYYNKYTYDLLLDVPVPYRSGFASFLQNYGAVSNKGVELSLHSTNVETKDFSWTTDFNISHNKNKIEKLASDITQGASGRNTSILREGYPVNSFFLYKQLYVDPQTGNAVYDDVNKDGVITFADRQIVGDALPNFTGGFTNDISYKNFSLNLFFYFQQGNKLLNMQDFFLVHGGTQNNIGFFPNQLKRWQKPGDVTDIPRLTTYKGEPNANNGGANNYGGVVANLSSRYLNDASFIRLKNISLSYNVPKSLTSKLHLNGLKATASASNLFTLTSYTGLDPEVSAQSSNQNTAGYDWATVPQPRTYQLILNITL